MPPVFVDPYVVKVGDICYALIGQIVNRNLLAVRYQPTGGLVVNSPIERPILAAEVRKDWSNVTVGEHETSLLADIRSSEDRYRVRGAFARLRYYYPLAYRALTGADRQKRDAFEAAQP